MALDHAGEAALDLDPGLFPGDLVPRVTPADEWCTEPVGICLETLERGALRAQESVAEDVVAIAAHPHDLAPAHGQLEAARRLAQRARAICRPRSCESVRSSVTRVASAVSVLDHGSPSRLDGALRGATDRGRRTSSSL